MKRQTHIILLLPLLFIFTGLAWGASNSNSTHLGYGHHYGHHGYMQSRNNVSDVADAIEKTSKSIEQINTKIAQLQQRINGHDVKIPATLGQLEQTLPAATKETENDLKEELAMYKTVLEEMRTGFKALPSILKNEGHAQSAENAIVMMVAGDNDLVEMMNRTDWTELKTPWAYGKAFAKAVAIKAGAGAAKHFGEKIDKSIVSMFDPLITSVKDTCLSTYRYFFKGGRSPFSSSEVTYWRDSVVNSLNLLLDSTKDIAEFEDRDRQQRQRDIFRSFKMGEGNDVVPSQDEVVQPVASLTPSEPAFTPEASFANKIMHTSVVRQLSRITSYIRERKAYYSIGNDTSCVNGQIIDMANNVHDALVAIKQEVEQHESLKDLSTPAFKAIVPHYIRYVSQCFDGLAYLVNPDDTYDKTTQGRARSTGWGNKGKKKPGLGGLGFD